jgi:DinB superfamily
MAGKRSDTLLNVMLFIEMYTLTRVWTELTNEEFFWEPLPGCWSVHQRSKCLTPTPFGTGDWVADFDADLVERAVRGEAMEPLTTVAWLMWHVGSMPGRLVDLDFLGGERSADSGWPAPYLSDHPVFTSADDAVQTMRTGWRALDRTLQASTDEQLERQTRFWGYPGNPGPPAPGYQIVASLLNEISHHGTQVCVLRDLYRALDGGPLT